MRRLTAILTAIALMLAPLCALADVDDGEASLNALTQKRGFSAGTVISYARLSDKRYIDIVKSHFGSVTAENEMKAYSLLSQSDSIARADGMPAMRYEAADAIVAFARDNDIAVRGHTLVWDAYMLDWFFREGYKSNGEYVDADTMKARLRSYIIDVVAHFERAFPGVVYCWDVVNEAVGDSPADWEPGDARHVRKTRNGEPNPFYEIIGSDYVELAFMYAREAAELAGADIKLFYNDYNAFQPDKSKAIRALVESVNSYADKPLLDGIGMQGYIGGYGTQSGCMSEGDITRIQRAIEAYADMGLQVQLTEMAVRTYKNDEATMQRHCDFYAKLFSVFKKVNAGERKPLTGVSIWGLADCPSLPEGHYSYKLLSPYGGLFTEKLEPKAELAAVLLELAAE